MAIADHALGPALRRAGLALWRRAALGFARHRDVHWGNLSRLTNLLVLLNISLFFLTHLVTREHYSYTLYSVSLLGVVHVGLVLPLGLLDRLGYYLALLAIEGVALYLLAVSVWYWITTSRAQIFLF